MCVFNVSAFELHLLTVIAKLQLSVDNLTNQVESQRQLMVELRTGGGSGDRGATEADFNLPASSVANIEELEAQLHDNRVRASLVS